MQHLDKEPNSRRSRILRVVIVIAAVSMLAGLIVVFFVYNAYRNAISGSSRGHGVTVEIHKGDNFRSVANRLVAQKVVSSAFYFDIYTKFHHSFVLLPGMYTMYAGEGISRTIATFERGPNEFKLTIIPGMTLKQIASRVGSLPGHSSRAFLAATRAQGYQSVFLPSGSNNLEGLLSPDTYFVLPDEPNHQLIQEMLSQTATVAKKAGLLPGSNFNSLSGYQELIVASLVQREALILGDYPKVSRVIYNRLAIPMNLQFDSTVLYGLGKTGGAPSLADLSIETPYNTYLNSGLPPTPISAPSYNAIVAAVKPAPGPWLYFVTTSADGSESFSVTYKQQLANEALAAQKGLA